MSAVYKRELRAYMNNVYGWLFMAIFLLFTGYMMFQNNLYDGMPEFELTLSASQYALLLLIPILCMRSMAEDRHNKTDMFYLSLPMKTASVVLGKYFAMLTVYAIPCAVICVYPLVLGLFGDVNFLSAYISILFFFQNLIDPRRRLCRQKAQFILFQRGVKMAGFLKITILTGGFVPFHPIRTCLDVAAGNEPGDLTKIVLCLAEQTPQLGRGCNTGTGRKAAVFFLFKLRAKFISAWQSGDRILRAFTSGIRKNIGNAVGCLKRRVRRIDIRLFRPAAGWNIYKTSFGSRAL